MNANVCLQATNASARTHYYDVCNATHFITNTLLACICASNIRIVRFGRGCTRCMTWNKNSYKILIIVHCKPNRTNFCTFCLWPLCVTFIYIWASKKKKYQRSHTHTHKYIQWMDAKSADFSRLRMSCHFSIRNGPKKRRLIHTENEYLNGLNPQFFFSSRCYSYYFVSKRNHDKK